MRCRTSSRRWGIRFKVTRGRSFSSVPFALSLSKGLFAVADVSAVRRIVARGLPGGKFLFLLAQEKEPKEGHPDIPEFPKIEPAGQAAKNSPRLDVLSFVFCGRGSNTFAADPPARFDFRRGFKGGKVRTRAVLTGCLRLLFELRLRSSMAAADASLASHTERIRNERLFF